MSIALYSCTACEIQVNLQKEVNSLLTEKGANESFKKFFENLLENPRYTSTHQEARIKISNLCQQLKLAEQKLEKLSDKAASLANRHSPNCIITTSLSH